MKLLRYGEPGREKPGMLGPRGEIRDLSETIRDLSGDALLPESLDKLRHVNAGSLREVADEVRLGRAWAAWGSSSASGSTILITQPNPG
jgi:hypothetical protein